MGVNPTYLSWGPCIGSSNSLKFAREGEFLERYFEVYGQIKRVILAPRLIRFEFIAEFLANSFIIWLFVIDGIVSKNEVT